MKKYFVAYRRTGESSDILQERMSLVVDALEKAGIDAYCNLFDRNDFDNDQLTARQKMIKAFEEIDKMDGLFVLIASNDKSEGQLMEVGHSLSKGKHIIAAVQEDVDTYVSQIANQLIKWHDLPDLKARLEGVQL